jgi:hypothetical protein
MRGKLQHETVFLRNRKFAVSIRIFEQILLVETQKVRYWCKTPTQGWVDYKIFVVPYNYSYFKNM